MRNIIALFVILSIYSCQDTSTPEFLYFGDYRAELKINDTEVLPFTFKVKDANTLTKSMKLSIKTILYI